MLGIGRRDSRDTDKPRNEVVKRDETALAPVRSGGHALLRSELAELRRRLGRTAEEGELNREVGCREGGDVTLGEEAIVVDVVHAEEGDCEVGGGCAAAVADQRCQPRRQLRERRGAHAYRVIVCLRSRLSLRTHPQKVHRAAGSAAAGALKERVDVIDEFDEVLGRCRAALKYSR